MRTYTAIQAQPCFRDGPAEILARPALFEPLFSPSERWTQAPEKFFRNYSIRYLEHVLGPVAAAGHQPSVA